MPKRAADVYSSPGIQINRPDSFSNYRSQVAELLSQGERISVHHDQEASESDSTKSVIGAGMSNLEKENLNVLLRQCVSNLTPEVDEMQQCVSSMSLISQLGNKCLSSSPSILGPEESGGEREDDMQLLRKSEPDLVKKITSQYSNVLLSKLDTMQQQLEKLLDDVVATCRPMTRGETRELKKSIKELPERNLNRVAQIVGNSNITSGKDNNSEVIVNLDHADVTEPMVESKQITVSSVPQCLLSSLEFVEIKCSRARSDSAHVAMELARFFAANSVILKKLVLSWKGSILEEDSVLRDLLALLRRPSTCQIEVCGPIKRLVSGS